MKEYSNKLPTELPLSELLRFYERRLKILFAVTLANFALIGLAYLLTILGTRLHITQKSWEWLVELILILAGIVLTHVLILYSQFYKESQGYMLRAAVKIWPFLTMFFVIEWAIGAFFFNLSLALPPYALVVPASLLGIIFGIIVAVIPSALESIFLPKKGTTVKTLKRPLTRVLLRLKVMLRHKFAWAIASSMEQDVYDYQQPNGWGLDVPPIEIGRRIRKLYEFYKVRIAEERQDPSFLRHDVGRNHLEKFYLLTRHLGRKRLRQYISNPPAFQSLNWDGRERRRIVGTRANRDPSRDRDLSRSRMYDDPELIKSIAGGRKSVSPRAKVRLQEYDTIVSDDSVVSALTDKGAARPVNLAGLLGGGTRPQDVLPTLESLLSQGLIRQRKKAENAPHEYNEYQTVYELDR